MNVEMWQGWANKLVTNVNQDIRQVSVDWYFANKDSILEFIRTDLGKDSFRFWSDYQCRKISFEEMAWNIAGDFVSKDMTAIDLQRAALDYHCRTRQIFLNWYDSSLLEIQMLSRLSPTLDSLLSDNDIQEFDHDVMFDFCYEIYRELEYFSKEPISSQVKYLN